MSMMDMKPSSRWADEIEDDDYSTVPTDIKDKKSVIPAPKDDEKVVTDVKKDPETGRNIKIFRTFRLEKQLVSKGVVERKKWAKFGLSKRDPPGPNAATTVVADDVQMQFLSSSKNGLNETNLEELTPLELAKQQGKGIVKCRFCQDNHFSAKCPYKDVGLPPIDNMAIKLAEDQLIDEKKDSISKPGAYITPAMRGGGNRRGETMNQSNRKDETTIRVSNLPESMSETDMQDLCTPIGKIERIFLAKDRSTGHCKGFAFVTFLTRESAQRALKALDGYGYDHLILNVEWSVKKE